VDPTFVVTGRFSTTAIYPLIVQVDSARRHLHVSTTHRRRGVISQNNQELAFEFHDLAGRALFSDLEWVKSGQRPSPPTAMLRLTGGGPAFLAGTSVALGRRWLTLADVAPLGTETYWVASPMRDVRLRIALSELPPAEPEAGDDATTESVPLWIRSWHVAPHHLMEYQADSHASIRMALPGGISDLWIASSSHGPVRLHGRVPELIDAAMGSLTLPPRLKEGAEMLRAQAFADPQYPFIVAGYFTGALPDAAPPVPEFAFRAGGDGLRMALLVPDSSLDGGRIRSGAYVSPYIPEFHQVPLDQPMDYVALGGRLERRATVMLRVAQGGWQLLWRVERSGEDR
jgi:hypothetical protein